MSIIYLSEKLRVQVWLVSTSNNDKINININNCCDGDADGTRPVLVINEGGDDQITLIIIEGDQY